MPQQHTLTDLLVVKFGGTSLGSARRIRRAARRVRALVLAGSPVVVVVSATGHTTDRILGRLDRLASAGSSGDEGGVADRERDRALATGEDLAAALVARALLSEGVPARSLRGGEAGLEAAGPFAAGRLEMLHDASLRRLLRAGVVPVVAGFQALRADGETVTLGRGGSDITAVFLAEQLGARECHIVTDVAGVYDADPRADPAARLHPTLTHDALVGIADAGAQVVHPAAAALARRSGTRLRVYAWSAPLREPVGTWIREAS